MCETPSAGIRRRQLRGKYWDDCFTATLVRLSYTGVGILLLVVGTTVGVDNAMRSVTLASVPCGGLESDMVE